MTFPFRGRSGPQGIAPASAGNYPPPARRSPHLVPDSRRTMPNVRSRCNTGTPRAAIRAPGAVEMAPTGRRGLCAADPACHPGIAQYPGPRGPRWRAWSLRPWVPGLALPRSPGMTRLWPRPQRLRGAGFFRLASSKARTKSFSC